MILIFPTQLDQRDATESWSSFGWSFVAGASGVEDAIICLLEHETLSISRVDAEALSIPIHLHERLSIPVFPAETLTC